MKIEMSKVHTSQSTIDDAIIWKLVTMGGSEWINTQLQIHLSVGNGIEMRLSLIYKLKHTSDVECRTIIPISNPKQIRIVVGLRRKKKSEWGKQQIK